MGFLSLATLWDDDSMATRNSGYSAEQELSISGFFGVWDGRVYRADPDALNDARLEPLQTIREFAPGNPIQAVMGWDGFFVFDPNSVDFVDMARTYVETVQRESCGKCVPCRMGTRVAADILGRIAEGKGSEEDIDTLRRVAVLVRDGSMCELGHASMNGVLALLEHAESLFRESVAKGFRHPRRTYHVKVTAPCIEACPERLNIPAYIDYIRSGRYTESLSVIQEKNPLASVCGRVCVRFCEFACRRGKLDHPVDIKHLKRFVSDLEMDAAVKRQERRAQPKPNARRVAVIGAGPAGITAAYHLLLKGYRVEIFEAMDEPGGMAAFGIPDYRLPRQVLRAEADVVMEMGGIIHYNQRLGRDFTLRGLREGGFDAVFIAIGCQLGTPLNIPGESLTLEGYYHGVEFLKRINRNEPLAMGSRVVVVGGGNVAMDCARSALRLGAREVLVVYRRTRAEMPADPLEIQEAEEEGVQYHFLANPVRILTQEGRVTGLECIRMELGRPDASGRRRPIPVEGSTFVLDCDMLIAAIGQRMDVACLGDPPKLRLTRWNTIEVNPETLQTSMECVFAGGDCVSGPATLIEAMAAGFRVSHSIDQYLREGRVELTEDERMSRVLRAVTALDEDVVDRLGRGADRIAVPTRSVEERVDDFDEVELGLSPEDALLEADRCLRCYRILLVATER